MAGHNRKEYMMIFGALTVLTIVEVAIPMLSDKYGGKKTAYDAKLFFSFMPHWTTSALLALSVVKAGLVGMFFMHLKHETKWLKFIAVLPAIAALYAVMLGAEAFYRYYLEIYNVANPVVVTQHIKSAVGK
ncbi:MAG: cytochrome C oxidase subunit IV family protein [Planctomycetota bacterium]